MPGKSILNYNDDATGMRYAPLDAIEPYTRRWVDLVLDHVEVDQFVLSVALPDIGFHRSNICELYGSRQLKHSEYFDPHRTSPHQLHGAKVFARLIEDGTDVIEVMAKRVHDRGVKFIAEVRVNDTHFSVIDPTSHKCSQFLLDHPDWTIKRTDLPPNLRETALDYSYPEVRAHRLAIIEELANRPEVDGVELNCNRWLKFFPREIAPEKALILTDFMGQVHAVLAKAARARGRDHLLFGARVSSTIEECRLAGIDIPEWLRRGYFDYLIVADWNWSNLQLPIEEFVELAKSTNCKIIVQISDGFGGVWNGKPSMKDRNRGVAIMPDKDGYSALRNTEAEARAIAANIYAWGGDGVGVWNVCDHMGLPDHETPKNPGIGAAFRQRMVSWMQQVGDPQTVMSGPRHYHYCPLWKWPRAQTLHPHREQYHSPAGGKHCQIVTFADSSLGKRQTYKFRMADGRNGEPLTGQVKFQIFHVDPNDEIVIDVNGIPVAPAKLRRDHRPNADPPATWFEFSLDNGPPLRGDNELGITLKPASRKSETPYLEELEVYVIAPSSHR